MAPYKRLILKTFLSQIYCRGELSEEEKGAYKWWLFDVSECDDDTSDAERSVQVESVWSRLVLWRLKCHMSRDFVIYILI